MGIIQVVRGMKDILPPEIHKFYFIEAIARKLFTIFGFQEIYIPILERTELFTRSIGETTDIIEKEMYTFFDRNGELISLRPEATAGIVRAYIEHKIYDIFSPSKLFTIGPMFRYERPQKGRFRQFYQINVEVLNDETPQIDAELIVMLSQLLTRLGIDKFTLAVNNLGCSSCRPLFRQSLILFLSNKLNIFCEDCQRRFKNNPLRILDCKNESCNLAITNAPSILDYVCENCHDHFYHVQQLLRIAKINFKINSCLVRGLDYYMRTTFEAIIDRQEGHFAIAGGGRYDGLVERLGGPLHSGIGFGIGLERLALFIHKPKWQFSPEFFFVAIEIKPRELAFLLIQFFRIYLQDQKKQFWIEMSNDNKSIKAQMRKANKLRSNFIVFLGDRELMQGIVRVKRMIDGQQWNLNIYELSHLFMNNNLKNIVEKITSIIIVYLLISIGYNIKKIKYKFKII